MGGNTFRTVNEILVKKRKENHKKITERRKGRSIEISRCFNTKLAIIIR